MSFRPTLPLTGLPGWSLLTSTRTRQEAAFVNTAQQRTLIAGFERGFPKVKSVDDLLKNRDVLQVVLGAFGLQDDLANKGFIRRVISDGTESPSALANRLTDKRYFALARALSHLGPNGTREPSSEISEKLKKDFQSRSFEVAVGEANQNFRLAMAFERELSSVLSNFSSDRARWFAILGNPPLRTVLETSLGLPKQIGSLPIEQQVKNLQTAMKKRFNISEVQEIAEKVSVKNITQRFIILSDIQRQASSVSSLLVLFGKK